MTENEFEVLVRQALLQANREEWEPILASGPAFCPSPRYLSREKKLLAAPFRCAKKQTRPLWKKALQAAACFILLVSVAFGGLMAVSPTARAWVQQIFTEWFGDHVRFTFSGNAGQETGAWKTGYLPEGFALVKEDGITMKNVVYENAEGVRIYLSYAPADENGMFSTDNEHQDYTQTTINGDPAHLLAAKEPGHMSNLIWANEEEHVAFKLMSGLDSEELIRMAEGVQKAP